MSRGGLAGIGLVFAAILWIVPQDAVAQPDPPERTFGRVWNTREWHLKTSYMYYFTQFVTWPEDRQDGDFVIGVLGHDPLGGYKGTLEGQRAPGGRRIVVRRFATLEEYDSSCHILFVSNFGITREETLRRVRVARSKNNHVLIVADTPGSAGADKAAFNFTVEGDRLRLQYSSRALASAGLEVSSRLTGLASVRPVH